MSADLIRPILIEDESVFSQIGFTWGESHTREIRCYREVPPTGSIQVPYMIYSDITGQSASFDNRVKAFMVKIWASDEQSCKYLAKALEDVLRGYSGKYEGKEVKISLYYDTDSHYEPLTGLWYSIRKFRIIYW